MVPEVGVEPTRCLGGGFSCHFGFRRPRAKRFARFVVWSTPSPWSCDFRCPPSALYTFPEVSGLGSASTRARRSGSSPTLTGFTSKISRRGLNFSCLSPLRLPIPPLGHRVVQASWGSIEAVTAFVTRRWFDNREPASATRLGDLMHTTLDGPSHGQSERGCSRIRPGRGPTRASRIRS